MDFLLGRVANRQTSTHYYFHEADETDQYYTGRQEISNQDFLGVVLDYDQERKEVLLTQRNYFKVGDEVEIFTPSGQTISFIVSKIYDEEHSLLDCARHPEQKLWLPLDEIVPKDAMMRKKIRMME